MSTAENPLSSPFAETSVASWALLVGTYLAARPAQIDLDQAFGVLPEIELMHDRIRLIPAPYPVLPAQAFEQDIDE